jgi:hypothetical protein
VDPLVVVLPPPVPIDGGLQLLPSQHVLFVHTRPGAQPAIESQLHPSVPRRQKLGPPVLELDPVVFELDFPPVPALAPPVPELDPLVLELDFPPVPEAGPALLVPDPAPPMPPLLDPVRPVLAPPPAPTPPPAPRATECPLPHPDPQAITPVADHTNALRHAPMTQLLSRPPGAHDQAATRAPGALRGARAGPATGARATLA